MMGRPNPTTRRKNLRKKKKSLGTRHAILSAAIHKLRTLQINDEKFFDFIGGPICNGIQPINTGIKMLRNVRAAYDHAALFRDSSIPFVLGTLDGRFIECNDAFLKMLGFIDKTTLKTKGLQAHIHHEDLSSSSGSLQQLVSGQARSIQFKKRMITSRGEHFVAIGTSWSVRDEKGAPAFLVCMMQRMPDQKSAVNG